MGLASDFAKLTVNQVTEAQLNGAVLSAEAAAVAGASVVTTDSQSVVSDLSNSELYPGNQAILTDPSPLPGGSYLLLTLAPGTTLGLATQQVAVAQ